MTEQNIGQAKQEKIKKLANFICSLFLGDPKIFPEDECISEAEYVYQRFQPHKPNQSSPVSEKVPEPKYYSEDDLTLANKWAKEHSQPLSQPVSEVQEELNFSEWYEWFTHTMQRKASEAEKNAINFLLKHIEARYAAKLQAEKAEWQQQLEEIESEYIKHYEELLQAMKAECVSPDEARESLAQQRAEIAKESKKEGREQVKEYLLNHLCHIGRSDKKYVFLGVDFIKQCNEWDEVEARFQQK